MYDVELVGMSNAFFNNFCHLWTKEKGLSYGHRTCPLRVGVSVAEAKEKLVG